MSIGKERLLCSLIYRNNRVKLVKGIRCTNLNVEDGAALHIDYAAPAVVSALLRIVALDFCWKLCIVMIPIMIGCMLLRTEIIDQASRICSPKMTIRGWPWVDIVKVIKKYF